MLDNIAGLILMGVASLGVGLAPSILAVTGAMFASTDESPNRPARSCVSSC